MQAQGRPSSVELEASQEWEEREGWKGRKRRRKKTEFGRKKLWGWDMGKDSTYNVLPFKLEDRSLHPSTHGNA